MLVCPPGADMNERKPAPNGPLHGGAPSLASISNRRPPAPAPAAGATPKVYDNTEHEVSNSDIQKWNEMIEVGIPQYRRVHPDRFHRRARRGVPPPFRWEVWKSAVKLDQLEMPYSYHDLANRENQWSEAIDIDKRRTFPELSTFDSVRQGQLKRVLNAYASYNPDVGYCQGMNYVAGLLLLVSENEEESFGVLVCLMDQMGLAGFYKGKLPLFRRYLRACEKLVAEKVPELREHFITENVQPAVYLHQWFLTLFINCFPLSMVMIIWDVIVCEGLPVILKIAVSILQVLKDSLLPMGFEEIIRFFKMMKTYDEEDGELNAFRIGQLLMKHTEGVEIPEHILQSLVREPLDENDATLDSDESWEADLSGGSWLQSFSRMFTFGSTRRRSNSTNGPTGPSVIQLRPGSAYADDRPGYGGPTPPPPPMPPQRVAGGLSAGLRQPLHVNAGLEGPAHGHAGGPGAVAGGGDHSSGPNGSDDNRFVRLGLDDSHLRGNGWAFI